MPIDKKVFLGGLDKDKDDRLIENGSYRDAVNVRAVSSDGSDTGALENIKGNSLKPLPPGYLLSQGDVCIGAHTSSERDSVLWFVCSETGEHGIYERFHKDGLIKVVLQNSILNFSKDYLITGINDIEGLLYWTDDYNPPRKINIDKAVNHTLFGGTGDDRYSQLLQTGSDLEKEQFINAIKAQPINKPTFEFLTDESVKTNNVRDGKYFKFKYRYVYDDGEKSAWSATSDLTYTDLDFLAAFSSSELVSYNAYNYINIYYNSGHETVDKVQICFSQNDSDFALISDVDVSASTNEEKIYSFYNDGIYTALDINDSIKPYDDLPRLAKSQEIVDGNKLVYGNYLSGYDNHKAEAQLSVSYEEVQSYIGDLEEPPAFGNTVFLSDLLSGEDLNFYDEGDLSGALFASPDNGNVDQNFSIKHAIVKRKFNHTVESFKQIIENAGYEVEAGSNIDISFSSGKKSQPYSANMSSGWNDNEHSGYSTQPASENWIISVTIPSDSLDPYEFLFNYLSNYDLVGSNGMYSFGATSGVWRDSIVPGFLLSTPWSTVAYNFHQYESPSGESFGGLKFFDKIHFLSENESPDASTFFNDGYTEYGAFLEISDYLGANEHGGFYWHLTDGLAADINGGYSNVDDTGETAGTIGIFSFKLRVSNFGNGDSFPHSNKFSTFKGGANHSFALAYHDDYGRHGLLNVINEGGVGNSIYVPHLNEREDDSSLSKFISNINWSITSSPPSWAKYYSWYYSGNSIGYDFLQFVVADYPGGNDFPPEKTPNEINLSLKSISDYNNGAPESNISYDFSPGDRIRVLKYATGEYVEQVIDLPILKAKDYPDGNYIITVPRDFNLSLVEAENADDHQNLLIEIYRQRNNFAEKDKIYYEISEKYPIIEVSIGGVGGLTGVNTGVNLLAHSQPTGTFNRGDVYVAIRRYETEDDEVYFISESPSISDTSYSTYRDGGRANYSDNDQGETRYSSQVTHSMPYVSGTKINGLSDFNPVLQPYKEYDRANGPIQKLFSQENSLIIFQEDKVNKSMVSRNVIFDNQGGGTLVGTTANVLSDAISYQGEYGISRNPESFAEFGGRIYFTDAKRGSVLRLSRDGLTPISDVGMSNYFMDLLGTPTAINGTVIGGFDPENSEYIISIQDKVNSSETVAFNEKAKRWTSRYSYSPDMIVNIFKDLVSFKDGNFYLHGDNETRNNFYGEQYNSSVKVVSNSSPSDKKVFLAIGLEGDDAWAATSITTPSGQSTNLLKSDFEEREGFYYSDILFDVNTPNVSNPLLEGDRIRDYAAIIRLSNDNTDKVELFAVNVNLIKSFRHNG